MTDVTRILSQIESGDPLRRRTVPAAGLRRAAQTGRGQTGSREARQTLQATALVHEAYLRLVDVEQAQQWDSRGHFFGAAAEAMRRILLNRARDKQRLKRGGDRRKVDLDQIQLALDTPDDDLVALDDAIETLARDDSQCAELVKLRYFAGLSHKEAAAALGITRRVADRQWAYARAWLYERVR